MKAFDTSVGVGSGFFLVTVMLLVILFETKLHSMATIETRVESERGCGFRKPGGLYMVGGRPSVPCGKLPIALDVCRCCGGGIKQSRGFSWIHSSLIEASPCQVSGCKSSCSPFNQKDVNFGLLWVGEKYYPTPGDFIREGIAQGISKRISFIPKDLVIGETWVMLAHPKAIQEFTNDPLEPVKYKKGIFTAFMPERIEYVVTGKETEDELNSMEKRGITLINVIPDIKAQLTIEPS